MIVNLRVFQQLFSFWIVLCFDLFIVNKVLLLALVVVNLEAMTVKCIFILISRYIMNYNVLSDMGSLRVV